MQVASELLASLGLIMKKPTIGTEEKVARWNFGQAILVAIITVLGSVVVTLLTTGSALHPQSNPSGQPAPASTIAKGLAVGYYYNFVRKIGTESGENVKILFPATEEGIKPDPITKERQRAFDPKNVEIEMFMPSALTAASLDRGEGQIRDFHQAFIVAPGKNRQIPIRYELASRSNGMVLVIKDFVQPCRAIKAYAEGCLHLNPTSPGWHQMEGDAIEAFKTAFGEVKELGDGAKLGQVGFKDVD